LEYFGQKHTQVCENCGSCKGDFEEVDITRQAQMVLSCVVRIYKHLGYRMGGTMVCKVLNGSRDKKLLELRLDQLTTYGLMKQEGISRIRAIADHLEAEGYLYTETEHQTLCLTEKASEILQGKKTVTMKCRREQEVSAPKANGEQPVLKLAEEDRELYELLRELRKQLAAKAEVAPFVVFSNATLAEMAAKKPKTVTEFRRISGVGELKASWYGKPFTEAIRKYLQEQA
jgi:ATP-dependent DNA helicase RecQ